MYRKYGKCPFFVLLLAYLLLGHLLYFKALGNGFHYDDRYVVLENRGITQGERILSVFTGMDLAGSDELHRRHYRPLVYASYMLNHAIGGWNPAGYHELNLLLHILTAFLSALVISILTGRFAVGALSGMIFLVHPVNAEAVNYVTARSSQMYALFYLLAFYAYLRFHPPDPPFFPDPSRRSFRTGGGAVPSVWLTVSVASFICSMLSKEMAVMFPVMLLLYEWSIRPAPRSGLLGLVRPWIVPAGLFLSVVVPYLMIRKALVGDIVNTTVQRDMASQLATQSVVLLQTVGLYLYPADLTIDHPVAIYATFASWPAALATLAWGMVLAGCLGWGRSRDPGKRLGAFLLIWYVVTLIPVILVPLNATLQENRAYLAGVGLIGLMALGVTEGSRWVKGKSIFWFRGIQVALILILVTWGVLVQQRNRVWQDDLSLWQDAVLKNPGSGLAHLGLGAAYQGRRDLEHALREYQEVLKIQPMEHRARGNLAQIYLQKGRYEEAMVEYRRILQIDPRDPLAHYQLGLTYQSAGRLKEAAEEYRKTLLWDPGNERARALLQQVTALGNDGERLR